MNVRYILRTDTVTDEDNTQHTVYGITALNENSETVDTYPDVFFDKKKAENFVTLCNTEKLELLHLADAVENILV